MSDMKIQNYSNWLDKKIEEIETSKKHPRLLLHACCAPCSSYVLEYLSKHFEITLFFYNPNISPKAEYDFRAEELSRLVKSMTLTGNTEIICEEYHPEEFISAVKGLENMPEGGERCRICYRQRLSKTADAAKKGGFDYFTTTLSISPYKNAEWLNAIGREESDRTGVAYLFSDFKKKNGYKRSCELSEVYGLYRQDYCGCEFSKKASEERKRHIKNV